MSIPKKIIDAHNHVGYLGRDMDWIVNEMDQLGIERAWLLSWEIAPSEDAPGNHLGFTPLGLRADGTHGGTSFERQLEAYRKYPDRFILGYSPHPAIGDAPALLRAAYEMYGIKICGEWGHRLPFDDPRCLEVFHVAGELKLPVVLHIDTDYLKIDGKSTFQPTFLGGSVERLERALKACPETIFVGHAPAFWREISGDADDDPSAYPRGPICGRGKLYDLFDNNPNLRADLSAGSGLFALQRDADHAKQFLLRYADRLHFGRDQFGDDLLKFLASLDLPQDVADKIYWQNAERLIMSNE